MLIRTERFELEYVRGVSLYIRAELKRGCWETLRDWSGNGLSTRSWTPRSVAS